MGTNLPGGGDHEVEPVDGDVDSDAHPSEVQIVLAQDGEEGFVRRLGREKRAGGSSPHLG